MINRNNIVKYLIDEFYGGDPGIAAKATGHTKQQIEWWLAGTHQPHKLNVSKLIFFAAVPEFKVITEFALLRRPNEGNTLHKRLAVIFRGHERTSGLYAFYDSMANLIYLGKTDGNMLAEAYQQIKAKIPNGILPTAIAANAKRVDVVRYISAYSIPASDNADYAKHVEGLILRISKPRLNKNLGRLKPAIPIGRV
jgi:hypothetical protein